jgi:hypothetical protein
VRPEILKEVPLFALLDDEELAVLGRQHADAGPRRTRLAARPSRPHRRPRPGRALAHEIGHFLLRSRHHSAAGLMRARQSAYDLVSVDRRGFTLTAEEEARLLSVMSTAF